MSFCNSRKQNYSTLFIYFEKCDSVELDFYQFIHKTGVTHHSHPQTFKLKFNSLFTESKFMV